MNTDVFPTANQHLLALMSGDERFHFNHETHEARETISTADLRCFQVSGFRLHISPFSFSAFEKRPQRRKIPHLAMPYEIFRL